MISSRQIQSLQLSNCPRVSRLFPGSGANAISPVVLFRYSIGFQLKVHRVYTVVWIDCGERDQSICSVVIEYPAPLAFISEDRIMKFYKLIIEDNRPHKLAGNDVTGCFRSAAKCYQTLHKSAQNGSGRTTRRIIRLLFNRESPQPARTSVPIHSKAPPDMTSLPTSDRHLTRFEKRRKIPSDGFVFAVLHYAVSKSSSNSRVKNIGSLSCGYMCNFCTHYF